MQRRDGEKDLANPRTPLHLYLSAMAPRIDSENRILELAVADLLEGQLGRSLGFAQRGGYERLWLGQAIHSHYQEEALAADGTYQREVVVRLELEHRGWRVILHGRIDGLRREPARGLVVEEIKSVRRGAELSAAVREMYERQALLYAWMLERQGEEPVAAELVLIEIGGGGLDREPLSADRAGLESDVHRRLSTIIRAEERQGALRELKHHAAETLAFPYPELRPGQEEILAAVETALEQREHLLLEATTGIGKTVAALYPALRYALARDKRVFVLTAKTLQQEMAETVVGLLARDGAFHGVRLRAKKKMCANSEVICHEEYCPYARDYFSKLHTSGILRHLRNDAALLTPDAIFAGAKAAEVCPFEVSLELSQSAEVVICDYNYVFDPYVALAELGGDRDLSDMILVIDEAHNLVDRGRGYYSPELTSEAARVAAQSAEGGRDEIHGVIAALMRRVE
ncbi:MAG TPA: DEAD/DEAH box helicase family protein, partial [Thermoanaerobaculia bacterium]|nr:DEAD/DEAH box helicase family protein [Thermoanaerobaculia bacterium]